MAPNAQEVIEMKRSDWNKVAGGWDKWDWKLNERLGFLNQLLVGFAQLRSGQRVLDLGSGTGYPALLAAQIVGPEGKVLGIDLAENMLEVSRRRAKEQKLANVEFRAADVTHLQEEAGSYDAAISRFCLMFLPEIPKALSSIARILRPNGILAAAVWSSPEKNPHISLPMGVLRDMGAVPPPDPSQPGIFRLAKPGDLAQMAQAVGLQTIVDMEIDTDFAWDSIDEYFESLMEIAAPIQTAFGKLSPAQQKQAEAEIKQRGKKLQRASRFVLPSAVRLVAARKP